MYLLNTMPASTRIARKTYAGRLLLCSRWSLLLCLVMSAASYAGAQQAAAPDTGAQPSPVPHRPAHTTHKVSKPTPATPATPPSPAPEPPKPPDWPAAGQPNAATVVWNSQGLRIDASNSSLQQILKDVSTATGAKVEGMGGDQRVFGSYGPGAARDVLSQLLDGSGYNVLMIGDQGQGTPREIVLSNPPKGPAPQVPNTDTAQDAADVEDQPQPQQPPAIRNGFTPGMPPRTPQQIMQEMQQRQQQIEMMQQQQRTNQPPQQPPQQ